MTDKINNGWIKLHRQLIEWEWYSDLNVRIFFIHCLLLANHETKKWRGKEIKRGQFITSLENISHSSGLTVQQVRGCIKKLKTTGEITCETTSQYSIISINNWNDYQENNMQNNKQTTNEQQTSNKRITTNKNEKNEKNEKNKKEKIKKEKDFFQAQYEKNFNKWLDEQETT